VPDQGGEKKLSEWSALKKGSHEGKFLGGLKRGGGEFLYEGKKCLKTLRSMGRENKGRGLDARDRRPSRESLARP